MLQVDVILENAEALQQEWEVPGVERMAQEERVGNTWKVRGAFGQMGQQMEGEHDGAQEYVPVVNPHPYLVQTDTDSESVLKLFLVNRAT